MIKHAKDVPGLKQIHGRPQMLQRHSDVIGVCLRLPHLVSKLHWRMICNYSVSRQNPLDSQTIIVNCFPKLGQ